MRRYLLCIFLATAVMSTGCNKSETPENASAEGAVRFLAGMNDREDDWTGHSTRGVALDNTSIHQFGVFCYNTGRTLWATAGATALPNKMYDVPVTRNGNDWVYNPPVKWEGGDGAYFTFMAYSPRATGVYQEPDSPLGNNLELTTTTATGGTPVLKYSTLDYVPMQIDLLVAAPVYDTYPVDKVPIKFGHALSQIRFKAWSAQDFVRVKRIEISNVKYSATLNLEGALTPETGVKTFTLDEINKTLSTDENKMTDLSDGSNAFMLLPHDFTGTTTSMIVVTYTSNGVESSSKPYTIVQNWEKGKSYTYTLKLGGNPTEVMTITGVTVTDWIINDAEDMETGSQPSGSYIPTSVLRAANWPSDRLPKTGLQVGVRGDKVLPGGTAAVEDSDAQWKTSNTSTPGTSPELGMGKNNMVAMAGAEHPAAEYCRQMGEGWYLPSTKEYQLIYNNKALFGADYSFPPSSYFTSTETLNAGEARTMMFDRGGTNRASKTNRFPVRCVREV